MICEDVTYEAESITLTEPHFSHYEGGRSGIATHQMPNVFVMFHGPWGLFTVEGVEAVGVPLRG